MRKTLLLCVAVAGVLGSASPVWAQNEAALRTYFEGKRVTLKIDMPATLNGVDLKLGTERPLDFKQHGDRLKSSGIAIKTGQSVLVTQVRLKKDLIEFQLAGGGYGHDTGSVYIPSVDKSNREKDLERQVKAETDAVKKKALQRDLDDVAAARERENARNRREATRLEEQNKARIAVERLSAGSRFNLRYPKIVPDGVKPTDIMEALAEYVDFSASPAGASAPSAAAPAKAASGQPRKGMLRADAERELGRPVETTDRREGALTVTSLVFVVGEQRITAEFVEGVLIKYTIASR
jgi:hypothetical protein